MCAMRNADDSWQDPARELMDDWNLGSEEEPSQHASTHPAAALPCEFGLDNEPASPAGLGAEDSFPVGPTLLYQAFAPMSLRPAGPASSPRAGGHRSADVGEEPADSSTAGSTGRSGKNGAGTRPSWPRTGDELGGFRLVVELGRGAFAKVFLAEEMNLGSSPGSSTPTSFRSIRSRMSRRPVCGSYACHFSVGPTWLNCSRKHGG